ncbi:2-nitropropane dioxygenase NPD [Methylocella silvestris BL2]|uniref:Nitronate monooxygenase n=1 Tax=Methylocella silvestris (strain DSM 15510 / CIP 108128 / LMG 27833 / NCIMB 13906 / BL2) TaxID=395965 RepID=B8ER99_METSB|nr:nitronate monooxygenase [Methylocella silvestris]ACK50283.1 2-nitropropane dioxygenase NPD [Methylocella silvestris BL2]
MNSFLQNLQIDLPIIQAPMAGTSTPQLAAAVSNAGGLGSIGLGASDAASARAMLAATRAATNRPFNVNLFCHAPARRDRERETAWLRRLAPRFEAFGAEPLQELQEPYTSFVADDAMLAALLEARPKVVSFHFGLPDGDRIEALRAIGATLFATATSLKEAETAVAAGVDAIVAQGFEAGGHRGVFDPAAPDDRLGTLALTRLLARRLDAPVIAAGGIMDGAGVAAALKLGAAAAQLGTAFIGCPESNADAAYRAALFSPSASHTIMTSAISGRPARCLANEFTRFGEEIADAPRPDYPIAYDAGKALNAAAKAKNHGGYGAQWAGQGAPLARAVPAAELMRSLRSELEEALRG